MKIKTYCTSLVDRTDRRKILNEKIQRIKTLDLHYIEGVEPSEKLPDHTPFWRNQVNADPDKLRKIQRKVAVVWAHYVAITTGLHCLKLFDQKWFLRLEDDVEFCDNFDARFQKEVLDSGVLETEAPTAITLGCQYVGKPPIKPSSGRPYDTGTVYKNLGSVGFYAIMFNAAGAKMVAEELSKVNTFGDVVFRNLVQSGRLHCYTIVPHLVTVRNDVSSVEGVMQRLDYIRKNYHPNWQPGKAGFQPKVIFRK